MHVIFLPSSAEKKRKKVAVVPNRFCKVLSDRGWLLGRGVAVVTCFVAVFVLRGATTSMESKRTFAVLIVLLAAEFFFGIDLIYVP